MSGQPSAPAAERNAPAILGVIREELNEATTVLEIGSGTGQHAVLFAAELRWLTWQPSDIAENLRGIQAWVREDSLPNVREPLELDVLTTPAPAASYDRVFTANTAHIMPWEAVMAMLKGVGTSLRDGAPFFLYGPFNVGGGFTAPGNREFDKALRRRDPAMGLRDVEALESEARRHQLELEERVGMPANNFLLVFRKREKRE